MHYAIFIPGATGASDGHFEAIGLKALMGTGAIWSEVATGGVYGMMATWQVETATKQTSVIYDKIPEWCEYEGFSIGIDPNDLPTPTELQRAQVPSRQMRIGEHDWQVPIAYQLPTGMRFDGNEWCLDVRKPYREFYNAALQVIADVNDQIQDVAQQDLPEDCEIVFRLDDALPYVALALSINYRVTTEVLHCLKFFDTDSLTAIVKTTLDLDDVLEVDAQKKNGRVNHPAWIDHLAWRACPTRPARPRDLFWLQTPW